MIKCMYVKMYYCYLSVCKERFSIHTKLLNLVDYLMSYKNLKNRKIIIFKIQYLHEYLCTYKSEICVRKIIEKNFLYIVKFFGNSKYLLRYDHLTFIINIS